VARVSSWGLEGAVEELGKGLGFSCRGRRELLVAEGKRR